MSIPGPSLSDMWLTTCQITSFTSHQWFISRISFTYRRWQLRASLITLSPSLDSERKNFLDDLRVDGGDNIKMILHKQAVWMSIVFSWLRTGTGESGNDFRVP